MKKHIDMIFADPLLRFRLAALKEIWIPDGSVKDESNFFLVKDRTKENLWDTSEGACRKWWTWLGFISVEIYTANLPGKFIVKIASVLKSKTRV